MFKLNSTNGKFDIVFTGDPLIDGNAKSKGVRATSAGRRKNDEWKSKVFDKPVKEAPNMKQVKTNKTSTLRLAKEKEKRGKSSMDGELVEPSPENQYDNKSTHSTPEKKLTKHKNKTAVSTPYKSPRNNTHDNNVSHGNIAQPKKSQNTKLAPKTTLRRDTYTFNNENNEELAFISKEQLNNMFSEFFSDEEDKKNTVEPLVVPGLQNLPGDTTQESKHQATQESLKSPSSNTLRQDEIHRMQATPEVEYNPWGKPGAGAPLRDSNTGDTQANLRTYKMQKDHHGSSKEENKTSPAPIKNEKNLELPKTSLFGRGQTKSQLELDEAELKRKQHLEHQRAIAEQVDEKRRIKQLERERARREEQDAEARFQREHELIQQRLEDEKRKELEKEEAKRKQQEFLVESIRKAHEEAMKERAEAKKARRIQPDKGKSPREEFTDISPRQPRKLHGESEAIVRSQIDYNETFTDNQEQLEIQPLKRSQQRKREMNKPIHSSMEHVLEKENKAGKSMIPKPKENNDAKSTKTKRRRRKDKAKNNNSDKDGNKYSNELKNGNILDTIVDDYLVPFHRTKTEMVAQDGSPTHMPEDIRRRTLNSSENRLTTEHPSSSGSPTMRQQQILNQLQVLRQGLMQKHREYISSSDTGYSVYR